MRAISVACILCIGMALSPPAIALAQSQVSPAKSERLQLYFFGSDSDPILDWFRTNPDLARVKAASQWFRNSADTAMFRERYAPAVGTNLPVLVMARECDGGSMFAASRDTMPRSSSELFNALKTAFNHAKEARKCPIPDPAMSQQLSQPLNQRVIGADGYYADATDCNGPNCPLPNSGRHPGGGFLDRLRPSDREEPFVSEGFGVLGGIRNMFWLAAGFVGLMFFLFVAGVSAIIVFFSMRRQ